MGQWATFCDAYRPMPQPSNFLPLYFTAVVIWGSTWIVIPLQAGPTSALWSVALRFGIAALVMWLFTLWRRLPIPRDFALHRHAALLGLLLFCSNYLLFYLASAHITSGLMAVAFSLLSLFNAFNARIFFKQSIDRRVLLACGLGVPGVLLLFLSDLDNGPQGGDWRIGLALSLAATWIASLGNLCSARLQKRGTSVVIGNTLAMTYGSATTVLFALILAQPYHFDPSMQYWAALLYLAVIGSVVAFAVYLNLIGQIGATRAGYISILIPVIALGFSTFFEGYLWHYPAIIGLLLISGGNLIILRPAKTSPS